MASIKIKKNNNNDNLDINNLDNMSTDVSSQPILKDKQEAKQRKMFANKKLNTVLIVVAAVMVVAFVAGEIYIKMH